MLAAGAKVIGIDLVRDLPVGENDAATKRLKKVGTDEGLIWVEAQDSDPNKCIKYTAVYRRT